MMKSIKFSFFLLLVILFCNVITVAQEGENPGFPLGVFSHIKTDSDPSTSKQLIEDAGINIIVDGINDKTDNISFDLAGHKPSYEDEYIFYYTKGYYTRWEAERDEYNFLETGFKHSWDSDSYEYGEKEYHKGAWCWATDSTSTFKIDSVLWGPNYRQDKEYTGDFSSAKIEYTADYRLALSYDATQYNSTDTVCVLKIVYSYEWYVDENNNGYSTDTIALSYLTLSQFPADSFKTFSIIYQYPDSIHNNNISKIPEEMYSETDITFIDDKVYTGIEFQLDWYGIGKLYIDYVDLYDNEVGWQIVHQPSTVRQNLITYANSFSSWPIEYWYVNDEPNTMDSYEPMRLVDSIVTNYATFKRPTITEIYPHWRGYSNGDEHLKKFVELAKPKQLMIDKYPFVDGYTTEWGLDWLRKAFQFAHNAQPGFWYVAQVFSQRTGGANGPICRWRRPDSLELNASVMLALAHGSKGILFWHFSPNWSSTQTKECGDSLQYLYFDGMVDMALNPTELYNYVKVGLSPRIGRNLGKTLLSLDYEGNYLQLQYFTPTQNPAPSAETYDYFTLGYGSVPATDMNWHAGFLEDSANTDNKHFLLANLWTNSNKSIQVKVTEPVTGYNNYRFRNVEGFSFDTTFNNEIIITLTHPKGEGYLYQVAPVVKYGGKLVANDTISTGIDVIDGMIIRNGVELLNEDNYTIKDTVTLEGTGFITGDGYIFLSGNGAIITNRWDKSLFKSRSGNHPMLIWGEYPSDTITVSSYKIYRKYGVANWQPLTTVPDTIFSYTDTTVTINPPGGQAGTNVHYKLTAMYGKSSETNATNAITINVPGDEIQKRNSSKNNPVIEYSLEQNYPNPFNPVTTIKYSIKYSGIVTLKIYDILGTEVKTLVNENKETGNYTVSFNASSFPSGVYFYKIKSGKYINAKKMILLK